MIEFMTKKTIPLLGDGDVILPYPKDGEDIELVNVADCKISVTLHAPKGERIAAIKIGDKIYHNPYED